MAADERLTIRQRVLDRRLARDLASILPREVQRRQRLAPAAGAAPISGVGRAKASELPASGEGIASPLTEKTRVVTVKTLPIEGTDGEVDVEQIDEIVFLDAADREVQFILKHPP